MTFLSTAEIDLGQLVQNFNIIKKASGGSRVLCVVKANAYGHGSVECVRALRSAGADYFAVADLYEAEEIREAAGESDVLILGATPPGDAPELVKYGVTQTVYSLGYARQLSSFVPEGKKLDCHMKLDTGMNRIGFRALDENGGEISEMLEAYRMPNLNFSGIFTHFACSDDPASPMTERQFERYMNTLTELEKNGAEFAVRHVCNSAAIVNYPEMRLDMVRAGIILYGFCPSEQTPPLTCKPIMTLRTTVTHVHTLYKGESVSYGATFTAPHNMRIATLAIGYADGFVRAYSGANSLKGTRGCVYINGAAAYIIGRICMDQCLCDVTGIDVKAGDTAVIFDKTHTADRLADAANTINYEVTSILTRRVGRIFIR